MREQLVAAIEKKLDWGTGQQWTNRDFEELSTLIFKNTQKRLSVTTLKRIWGRAELIANPSTATLDILSEFLGHTNWRGFVKQNGDAIYQKKKSPFFLRSNIVYAILGILTVGLLFGFIWRTTSSTEEPVVPYSSEDFLFTSRPVSNDIPNSVVFEYDASAAEEDASIEIQQSWDQRKRFRVNQKDSIATCIYYHPGFFKAKLVVDGTVVKEHDIFIPTQDWLGVIERDTLPIYLKPKDILNKDRLAISSSILDAHSIDPSTSRTVVGLYRVQDFGELYTNDFELSALLKNDYDQGINACQGVQITILYDGGAIIFPLSDKGCTSELSLMAFGQSVDGKKTDLSRFGVDFDEKASVRCVSKDGKLQITINEQVAYTFKVPKDIKKIVGLQIHFEGAGSLYHLLLKNKTNVAYETPFEPLL